MHIVANIFDDVKAGFLGTLYFVDEDIDFDVFFSLNIYEKSNYTNVMIKRESQGSIDYTWR